MSSRQSSTRRPKSSSKTSKGTNKAQPQEPPPLKIDPVYPHPLNYEALMNEQKRVQEIVDRSLPVLSSRRSQLEKEKELILNDPSKLYENEEYLFFNRATKYIKKNIIGYQAKDTDLEISNGATDLNSPDDADLKNEIQRVYKQPKAVTLWGISDGTSTLSNRGATSSYFMDDYYQYTKADTSAVERGAPGYFSTTMETKNSRPSSGALARRIPASPETIMSRSKSFLNGSSATPSVSQFNNMSITESGNQYIHLTVDDHTWRTYSAAPSGRTINSIYHPNTKRPSRVSNFIEKSKITNESLFTYLSTEFVEELDLERCSWLHNKVLINIGQLCGALTTLNLQHCTQVIDSTIKIIVNGCPDIKFLNLGMCYLITDEAVKEVFRHCKNLRVLSTHSCEKITGESFFDVKECNKLEVLDVSYCTQFTDIALQYVSEYCPKLIHLDISGCSQIGSDGLSAIYRHCSDIETLRLMLCDQPSLTPACLSLMTKFARSIKVLELTGVRQLTDEGAQTIAKFGSNIQFLSISGCVNVADATIKAIGQNCSSLRCLELCACKKVTVQSLLELIHTIKTLTRLVISECNISDSELEILRKYSSRCTILKHAPVTPVKQNYYVMYTKTPLRKTRKKAKTTTTNKK